MVRRRLSFVPVLALVSITILYLTINQKGQAYRSLYPSLNPSDIKIPVFPLKLWIVDNASLKLSIVDNVSLKPSTAVNVPVKLSTADNSPECQNGSLVFEDYCVISPYNEAVKSNSDVGLVTLCTQGTVEFLQHVSVLCNRWARPISVAVYSPQEDYLDSRVFVQLLRQCDPCVRYWVNWHFFMSKDVLLPPFDDNWQLEGNCSSITDTSKPRKRRSQGTYPINVGRNIARRKARTPYVFSIDIELYPSLFIPAKFERMLRSQKPSSYNQVWVFPVFEVKERFRAPHLKYQLRNMFRKKVAISFHKYRCNICHKIPNLTQWMAQGAGYISEVEESLEPMRVWKTIKRNRHYKLQGWEPFFIGTIKDPEFDIRMSWEGKLNKMQMAYEMCMRNYDFHVVENAFLVHTPGINVYKASKDRERRKYQSSNRKVFMDARKKLIRKYGNKNNC